MKEMHIYIYTGTSKKKIEYHAKGHNFLSLISESETHILYRFIKHRVKYFKPLFLIIIKTQNSVSQKIWTLHQINKKGYFKHKCQAFEKYVHFYAINTWLGLLLHELLQQCGVAWRQSARGTAQVWWKHRFLLIAAFGSSALLGLVSLIFLLTIPHRFSMKFSSGEFAGQSSTVIPWPWSEAIRSSVTPCNWVTVQCPGSYRGFPRWVSLRTELARVDQRSWVLVLCVRCRSWLQKTDARLLPALL